MAELDLGNHQLGSPEPKWRECEACGTSVRFFTITTPDGSPDFIQVSFPEGAWVGWVLVNQNVKDTPSSVSIVTLCSRSCLVEWFDHEHAPGA